MIQVITIENGVARVEEVAEEDALQLPTVNGVISDRIYIRPDWPPIGDPAFAEKLRAWSTAHNRPSPVNKVNGGGFEGVG